MEHLNDPNETAMDGLHDEHCDEPWWDDGPSEDPDHVWFRQCSDATQLYARIWNHQFYADSIVASSFSKLLLRLCENRAVLKDPGELNELQTLVTALEGLGCFDLAEERPPLEPRDLNSPARTLESLFASLKATAHNYSDIHARQKFFSSDQPKRGMEALEIDIDPRGEPFDLETVCNYTGKENERINNILITTKSYIRSYPVALIDLLDIAWIKEGAKGRGKSHEFRRAKAPAFDCIDHLLSLKAGEVHRNLVPGKELPTLRVLLRKIRDDIHPASMLKKKSTKKSDSKSGPSPISRAVAKPRITSDEQAFEHCKKHYGGFYSTYGIFPNGRKGVIFDNDGQAIQRLFAGTAWEGGLHAKMMRGLRRAETLSWDELQLPYEGECTLIPWNSLIIDLDESRD